ncbi:MAG: hypothetical protein N2486_01770 [Caloramator sp.]|nr:hypothetical protein [Caloramator sp.]
MIIKITDLAMKKIIEAAKNNNKEPIINIYIERVTCNFIKYGLVFDDSNEKIHKIIGPIKVVIDEELNKYHKELEIDYVLKPIEGFSIKGYPKFTKRCFSCDGCIRTT